MVNIAGLLGIGFICGALAIAGTYLWHIFTRPKKIAWNARVYTLSEGVKKIKDKDGKLVYNLNDLEPYTIDILEKRIEDNKDIYYLQKLRKTTSPVLNSCVERWGDKKVVDIVLHNDVATILQKGYDKGRGKKIFNPIPYEDQNMIKNEIAVRRARVEKEKNLLTALLPYVSVIFAILFGLSSIYLNVELNTNMNKYKIDMEKQLSDKEIEIAKINREGILEFAKSMEIIARENQASTDNLTSMISSLNQELDKKINNEKKDADNSKNINQKEKDLNSSAS